MYRALIFDLDDTLLDRRKRVRPANHRALLAASEAGFRLVMATSRPMRSVRRFLPADLLSAALLISLNGAVAHLPGRNEDPVILGGIGSELQALIAALAATEDNVRYSVETDGHRFASSVRLDSAALWETHAATPDMLIELGELNPAHATKVAADGNGRTLSGTLALQSSFPALRFIAAHDQTFVNIVAADVDKSTALERLKESQELALDQSVAFGDDVPDLGMFSVVGRSVAMANGDNAVKGAATDVIDSCETDAIARFLFDEVLD